MSFKKKILLNFLASFILVIQSVTAQKLYNKEVKASIKIDKTSEFVTFTATAENLMLSDYSLRYEFMMFKSDFNNNTSKSLQGNRFYLKANEKKILSSVTINNNEENKVILLLLVYPIVEGNEEQGAIGKDRLVITGDGTGSLNIELDNENVLKKAEKESGDQDTSEKDGINFQGLIIQKTLTKSGRDFYRYFYSDYYNKQVGTTKNIIIEEVPGQRRSTRISVKVDGQLVWQFFANPKKEFLKQMASTALDRSIYYLQQLEQQKESLTRY